MQNATVELSLIRIPEVEKRTGLSRASIYRLARVGEFPKSIKIGLRASAWIESEVDAWVHARIAEARRAAA